MGVIETLGNEMLQVRRDVWKSTGDHPSEHRFAIYVGRKAEMRIKMDPEIFRAGLYFSTSEKKSPNTFMGALIIEDYGLPEEAVCIHVDGKPYTTFSLHPSPDPAP